MQQQSNQTSDDINANKKHAARHRKDKEYIAYLKEKLKSVEQEIEKKQQLQAEQAQEKPTEN